MRPGVHARSVIGYASRTGTKRNLDALRGAGWHLLVSATGVHRTEGFPYALDNGAWTAHQQDRPWDRVAFERLIDALGEDAEFVIAPDIVGGGARSLARSIAWLPTLRVATRGLVLIPVQDGMQAAELRPYLNEWTGIFLGGTTGWKLATMKAWGVLAREADCYFHVGRVNTQKRIRMCQEAGAHSFDGTSVSRFAVTLPQLDAAIRQGHLKWG